MPPAFRFAIWLSAVGFLAGCRESPAPTAALPAIPAPESKPLDTANAPSASTARINVARVKAAAFQDVNAEIGPDSAIASLLQPYTDELNARMGETIGHATGTFDRDRPESALGNLITDAMLDYARKNLDSRVDVSLMNNGGIRVRALPEGPISVADIYQMVPFDNRVVIVELDGRRLATLIDRLAKRGGEPWSGCRYQLAIDQQGAKEIHVAEAPINPEKTYRVATLDYIASIGGDFSILQDGERKTHDDAAWLRDAVIGYVREQQSISPTLDGRVIHETTE